MKCDDFAPFLASGNFVQRSLARWHAQRCRACRRSWVLLDGVGDALAETLLLTDKQCRLWTSASAEQTSAVRPIPRPAWGVAITGAAVVLVVLSWLGWRMIRPNAPDPEIAVNGQGPAHEINGTEQKTVEKDGSANREEFRAEVEAPERLQGLQADLRALTQRLEALSARAALLDERREVARLAHLAQRPK